MPIHLRNLSVSRRIFHPYHSHKKWPESEYRHLFAFGSVMFSALNLQVKFLKPACFPRLLKETDTPLEQMSTEEILKETRVEQQNNNSLKQRSWRCRLPKLWGLCIPRADTLNKTVFFFCSRNSGLLSQGLLLKLKCHPDHLTHLTKDYGGLKNPFYFGLLSHMQHKETMWLCFFLNNKITV